MRLVTPEDDQLYGLAYAAARLAKADALLAQFEQAREADPGDADAACRHALALMATLSTVGASFEAHAQFTFAIEAFEDVLAAAPDHWLARYSLARLRALIPSGYGTVPTSETNLLAEARAGLADLIDRQRTQTFQPYFASTIALAAVVDQLAGETDPGRWSERLAALATCPRQPVALPHLSAVLCEPFITLHAGCPEEDRKTVGEVMAALYGDHPAVAAALGLTAAR